MSGRGGAESFARSKQFDYAANSNLVLTAERSGKMASEPTGAPESLWGKMAGKMGDRARPAKEEFEKQKKADKSKRAGGEMDDLLAPASKRGRRAPANFELDARVYRPRTRETREAYEGLLSLIQVNLGEQPQDILHGAADEVLAVLKNDRLRDPERHSEIERLVGGVPSEKFAQMVAMGKMITDYVPEEERFKGRGDNDEGNIDEDIGVAVEFDDEDEEEGDLGDIDDEIDEEEEAPEEEGRTALKAKEGEEDGALGEEEALHAQDIDAYWLQRQVSKAFGPTFEAAQAKQLADDVYALLSSGTDDREVENRLVMMLDFDKFELIKMLLKNRLKIVWCTKLNRAQNDAERAEVTAEMQKDPALLPVLAALQSTRTTARERQAQVQNKIKAEARRLRQQEAAAAGGPGGAAAGRSMVDLESLVFAQGGHFMSNKSCNLPEGSYRTAHKGYEEVHVPALKAKPLAANERLVEIKDLPEWAQAGFEGMTTLNRIQSKVCETALYSNENILMCAPTGAGKTNVAMLCVLHELGMHLQEDGSIDTKAFKIVYVAPMKALVAEMVGNFSSRLSAYGIKVRELTGDMNLTKSEIDETQIIVTTPEKWDIITRKAGDRTYTNLVKLVIIDEIHLLHDDRGQVLESIVARTVRQIEATQEMVRLVGLSATLPNYEDVAAFLRVKPEKGLFYFDNSFRPCPLEQTYIGVTVRKPLQRFQLMNEICYDKVAERAGKYQILIFVHSRKETAKTAKYLRDTAMSKDVLGKFLGADSASREVLREMAESCKNNDLKDLLPYGFAIHHAGMARADRDLVEALFADKHVQVLISTATLAWGVNLPAHTVIIKGTQVYNPVKSGWDELSMLDMMQMLGRAGRPQHDTYGEGIILTGHSELQYYLSLLNQQLPVESQYVGHLADNLNAEVVLGTVTNVKEAASWLGYTYLYVRMLRNPALYGVPIDAADTDPLLQDRRMDLVHSAAVQLERHNLIKYDRRTGQLQATDLGRIASHYYVTHNTIATYNEHLKPSMGEIDLLRLFTLSDEFKYIVVREEEKLELAKLAERVPIPVKESIEEPRAKINLLLQCYISRLKLEGLALQADMVYVTQSAGRLVRCLFEICLRRSWVQLAEKAMNLCKMVNWRTWASQTPLRQFKGVPGDVLTKMEKKDLPWERFYDLTATELGELVRVPKLGKSLHKLIHMFPKVELSAHVLPITRSVLKVDLTITPDFQWDDKVHGFVEPFWIWVEDADSETILHTEYFLLKQQYAGEDHTVSFTVPITEPLPPQYFIRVLSDKWLQSEAVLPVSFRHLLLPEKFAPPTELLDLQPLPVSALRNPDYEALFRPRIETFNPIQTQVFTALYNTDDSCLLCAPTGSGKTVAAEFALLRMITRALEGHCAARCVYVASHEDVAKMRFADWTKRFGSMGLTVAMLTGDVLADGKIVDKSNIVVAMPEHFDALSRKIRQRKSLQQIALLIVDDIHLVGGQNGHVIEMIVSRMRFIGSQLPGPKMRLVALSAPLANAKDLAAWCGATSHATFNFPPSVRPVPLHVEVRGFEIANFESRMQAMTKPCYAAINLHCGAGAAAPRPAVVFVPTRKHARQTSLDLLTFAAADGQPRRFLQAALEDVQPFTGRVKDKALKTALESGVGYLYDTQSPAEREVVLTLYEAGALQVVVATAGVCWSLELQSRLVVIQGTQHYDGSDYPLTDLLKMMGRAGRQGEDETSTCVLLCHGPRKEYYKRFLLEPFPVESHLAHSLHDHFNAEIVTETIESKQEAVDYLTWTFYYRRLALNPNYYNMTGVSHRHVSDHLSELVEQTISDLEKSGCVVVEDNEIDVKPANLGRIAAFYYVRYTTIEIFRASLTAKTKQKGLLEILCAASEFDDLPVRPGDEEAVRKLLAHAPLAVDSTKFHDPHLKANALLQAHFSRVSVQGDLAVDQRHVLLTASKLLSAMVDVVASEGWVGPLLAAMELCQMVVQGQWTSDSPLLQLPHISRPLAQLAREAAGCESIYDLLDLEDEDRAKLLGDLSDAQMADVARVCNRYPDLQVSCTILNEPEAGEQVGVQVTLERDWDVEEQGPVPPVDAPRYPATRLEGWWVVGVDPASNSVLFMKKTTLDIKATVKAQFVSPPVAGQHQLKLYVMADSYLGCDQVENFTYTTQ